MEFVIKRTLNGAPISKGEMKSIPLANKKIDKVVQRIQAKILAKTSAQYSQNT